MNLTVASAKTMVVLNVDDVGMCQGANQAFVNLARAGRVDSGSAMVPCPWFREAIDFALEDPSLRLGVHLTLNAEKVAYRWRPLIGVRQSTGLVDTDGYFWRSVDETRKHADPNAVEDELHAQIDAFLATGVPATHIDGHMGTVLAPEFNAIYMRLADHYGLPALFVRQFNSYGPRHNFGVVESDAVDRITAEFEQKGRTLADRVLETPWHLNDTPGQRFEGLLDAVGPGLNHFSLHPNCPGEIELIEPDSARIRTEEYDYLAGDGFGKWLASQSFQRGTLPA